MPENKKLKTRSVFLYKIYNRDSEGYDQDEPFEDVLKAIMKLNKKDRSYYHKNDDPEAFVCLLEAESSSDTQGVVRGLVGVYGSPDLKTGTLDKDIIENYKLPDGKLPAELVHFVYFIDDRILALVSNNKAIQAGGFIVYVNYCAPRAYPSKKVGYKYSIVCHNDAVSLIRDAKFIKSAEVFIPREYIESKFGALKLFQTINTSMNLRSNTDGLGSVGLVFKPAYRQKLGSGKIVDDILKEFPIDETSRQIYKVGFEDGVGIATVNLMQAKFRNIITIKEYDNPEEYNESIYKDLIKIYTDSKEYVASGD